MNEGFNFSVPLTDQQFAAATAVDGPVLLLAVPGSGKTTVLVSRLGYMLYGCGIRPENILTVTYTVAATNDMRMRFSRMYGDEMAERLEFRTLNGLCASILSQYAYKTDQELYSLMEEKDINRLIGELYFAVMHDYAGESDIRDVRTWISYTKNMMFSPDERAELAGTDGYLCSIFDMYQDSLRKHHAMDYDDQIVYAYRLLTCVPALLDSVQDKYRYICVDEAQDTSKIQHMLLSLLAAKYHNIFMVGDEDQSIYGFRAAYPEALVSFEKTYPGARVLLMEQNFRSVGSIVAAADKLIRKNTMRHKKHMFTTRAPGAPVRKERLENRNDQYIYLSKVASECTEKTAVLYRDNDSVIPLIDILDRKKIPYNIRSSEMSFFTHRIVTDITNIIRFAYSPCDRELFMQIYYKIGTYLRRTYAEQACEISRAKNVPILQAVCELKEVPESVRDMCRKLETHLRILSSDRGDQAVRRIVKRMSYGSYLSSAGISDAKTTILEELGRNTASPTELVERLRQLRLLIMEKAASADCKFVLSTVHSAKGLEYDHVYLIDVEDGLFPLNLYSGGSKKRGSKEEKEKEKAALEEERRLFYVAVTRARKTLTVLSYGKRSMFIDELTGYKTVPSTPTQTDVHTHSGYSPLQQILEKKTIGYVQTFIGRYEAGKPIYHKRYGNGTVTEISEDGKTVRIRFGTDEKRFSTIALLANGLVW